MNRQTVSSEVTRLRHVVVHPPGLCHDLLTPEHIDATSPNYMLFDDLIKRETALTEHSQLVSVLEKTATVYTIKDLLIDLINRKGVKHALIKSVCEYEGLNWQATKAIKRMYDAGEIADTLITGKMMGHMAGDTVMSPLPNLIFTRDLGAVIGNAAVFCYAATFPELNNPQPRGREMLLMRLIMMLHPLFKDYVKIDINDNPLEDKVSIEGGDILVINEQLILVGVSERTGDVAANRLAKRLFKANKKIKHVVKVHIPESHGTMHLDTVFTMIDEGECLTFHPVIENDLDIQYTDNGSKWQTNGGKLLKLLAEYDVNLKPFPCGGGDDVFARREQWTDGANALAIKPGMIVGYGRNSRTSECLEQGGYKVMDANTFTQNGTFNRDDKVVVTINSAELSRGRGGPRCLTMPIARYA